MTDDLPLVSIVTPSYQQAEFIEDTILSVKDQTYANIEHIVIDGGSTDGTVEILKRYEKTYSMSWISEPDEGQADAINKGLSKAKGQLIGWLNSDDIYFNENVVAEAVDAFENTGADIVFGNDALIGPKGEILRIRLLPKFNYGRLLRYGGVSQPALFALGKIFEGHRLRTDLNFAMDTELWLRLAETYQFYHLDKVLAGNRIHARRKMVAHMGEAFAERRAVAKEYGLNWSNWTTLQSMIFDKPLTAALRLLGLWRLWRMDALPTSFFRFVSAPVNIRSAVKAQLIGKF